MWKKWFNNRSMNRWEARLGIATEPSKRTRDGSLRYDFRRLEAKEVNTRAMRYGPGYQPR
jgi:hypothetical protein